MNNLKEQVKQAFFWDFLGKILKNGSGFIVTIFLARLLEPKDFGLIAMVMVFIGLANIFTNIGLTGALIQRRRVLDIHYSSVFYFNLFMATILTIIVYFLAPYIGVFYNNNELTILAKVVSFTFILNALSTIQTTILRKELQNKLIAKYSLIASVISGVIGIVMAFNGFGVWSLIIISFVGSIINNILLWKNSKWRPSFSFSIKALMQLWAFGFRMFLSGLLENIYQKLDYMIIGKLFDATTLGFFQRAKSFNQFIIRYSSQSLMSVLFPVLSKIQRDIVTFQKVIKKAFTLLSFVTFFLVGIFYSIGEELILILFGEKWKESVDIFKILILSSFSYPISALLVNVLSSRGNSKAFLRLEIYKKILAFSNIGVLYFAGIEYFLYGLIVLSFLGVGLNIAFVIDEISLLWKDFIYPIITQILFSTISIFLVLKVVSFINISIFFILILKMLLFTLFYIVFNYLFKRDILIDILNEVNSKKEILD